MKRILSIKELSKKYHDSFKETTALFDINMSIYEGELIAIVGASGCGKSTLLSIIGGLEKQSSGEIKFYKEDIKIGYMLQSDTLFSWRTILQNCMLGLELKKQDTLENREKVIELLKIYGLKDFMDSYPKSLSGGMKQRAALIRTLAVNPDILLLDEAFSALDYQTRLVLSDDIFNIIKKEKKTTIMVTHDLSEAISMADRVYVLSSRPGHVKNVYEINLVNKSTPIKNREAKEFAGYYNKLWKDLDINV
jgi:ABC-type nitrate/sulfonate/bicarbonate transport system, ATPase component